MSKLKGKLEAKKRLLTGKGLSFEKALEFLKAGYPVRRNSYIGEELEFIYLDMGTEMHISDVIESGFLPPPLHDFFTHAMKNWYFLEKRLMLFTWDYRVQTYTLSQEDLHMTDWEVCVLPDEEGGFFIPPPPGLSQNPDMYMD